MGELGMSSIFFGSASSVTIDGREYKTLSTIAKHFGVNSTTFYQRCETHGLEKAIEITANAEKYTIDDKTFNTKKEVAEYFGIEYKNFQIWWTRDGIDKAIEHFKEVTKVIIENGEIKREHLITQVHFERGYSYKKDITTELIEIVFDSKVYKSYLALSRGLNCSSTLATKVMKRCIENNNITKLKNLSFKVYIDGKEVHGMNGLYALYPTVDTVYLCKAIQDKSIDKLDEIISTYNNTKTDIQVGNHCFADYDGLVKYLGVELDLVRPEARRRRFYSRLAKKGLKDALAHYFQLYVIGINPDGHTIIQYKCPVCGKTLVANMDAEENMAHSEEFCRSHSVEDWTPPKTSRQED